MSYAHYEAARFLLACFTAGSIAGLAVTLARGERHG